MGPLWLERKNAVGKRPVLRAEHASMGPLWLERKNNSRSSSTVGLCIASMGPLWLERKNVVLIAHAKIEEFRLQWGRSGWSGRTIIRPPHWHAADELQWGRSGWSGRTRSDRSPGGMGSRCFNGAALVGAEEPRPWNRKCRPCASFNGAALVGAEERAFMPHPHHWPTCFNGAALVGAEERRAAWGECQERRALQWGRSGWSGRTWLCAASRGKCAALQWGRSGWSGRTSGTSIETIEAGLLQWGRSGWSGRTRDGFRLWSDLVRASMGPLWLERKNLDQTPHDLRHNSFNGAALVGAEEP